jgi:tetratricopeptide (TPR) repeat protein
MASQAMRLDPNDHYARDNLASAYMGLNRFDEARSIAEQAEAQKLGGIGTQFALADLAFIRGDWPAYDHEIDLARGTPNEPYMLFWKASGQDGLGKVKASRQTWQQARSELLSAGARDFAGILFGIEALNEALLGYTADARQESSQATELSKDQGVRGLAATALAVSGDVARSSSLIADLSREFPDNQFLRLTVFPMAQAAQDLQKNQPTDAITALETVRPYELGGGRNAVGYTPNFLRGSAYLKLRDGVKAAAEFQRILDHRGVGAGDPAYPLARLNLALAYVLQGNSAKARTAYQDFFAMWKDADPDVPVLIAAKAEYEKLK